MSDWLRLFSSLVRTGLALLLVWLCVQNLPALRARDAFGAIPPYDYLVEADRLRSEERFSEALLVLDAAQEEPASAVRMEAYADLRQQTIEQRDDWSRRLAAAGQGALTGRGDSVEALSGAVVADLFVFGDVRDLVIEGGKTLRGEDNDEVIVALSAAGLVLTIAPEIDFGTAIIKFARRAGAMTERLAARAQKLARAAVAEKNVAPLTDVVEDVATLGRVPQPAGALRILKAVDDPEELKIVAKLAERADRRFALWVGERPAVDLAKAGPAEVDLMVQAARRGKAGVEFASRNARLLLAPHPLMGLVKGIWKGNVPALLDKILVRLPNQLLGVLCGWLAFEGLRLLWRVRVVLRRPRAVEV